MINKVATSVGRKLAVNVNSHTNKIKFLNQFNDEEIEQILIYKTTNNIKYGLWIILLVMITSILYLLGIDIRYTTFIFFITLSLFRNKFGGYHAEDERVCLIISTIIPILAGYIAIKFNFNAYIILSVYILAYFLAFFKKTVDNKNKKFEKGNKRLTPERKLMLFKVGVILLLSITFVHAHLYLRGYIDTSDAITLAIFIAFFNLLFGK